MESSRLSFRISRQRELDFCQALSSLLEDAPSPDGLTVFVAVLEVLGRRYYIPRAPVQKSDYFKNLYVTSSPHHFVLEMRMTKPEFDLLTRLISPFFEGRTMRQSLPVERKLFAFIRYYSSIDTMNDGRNFCGRSALID